MTEYALVSQCSGRLYVKFVKYYTGDFFCDQDNLPNLFLLPTFSLLIQHLEHHEYGEIWEQAVHNQNPSALSGFQSMHNLTDSALHLIHYVDGRHKSTWVGVCVWINLDRYAQLILGFWVCLPNLQGLRWFKAVLFQCRGLFRRWCPAKFLSEGKETWMNPPIEKHVMEILNNSSHQQS